MIDQATLEGKVIIAAFDLAASPGWPEVSLRDIADAAGCSLADVMETFADKDDVLKVFGEHIDRTMLAGAGDIEREQSARDAVFEVIMSRFDAMTPFKSGLRSIVAARRATFPPDPAMVSAHLKTQNKILQAAGISASGTTALVRQLGLARLYDQVFRIWLDDEDPGMARTMAALDKRLRQGERSLRTLDELADTSGRMCEQATSFASRMLSIISPQSGPRDEPSGDVASASQPPPSAPQDVSPGNSPTV